MKKFASLLLCMVLVLSMFPVNAAAAENTCIGAEVTVADGTVTVVVSALQTAANARLHVTFDANCLTYVDYETAFAAHSVREEAGKITIGLANSSANAVETGAELARITFAVTGGWDQTGLAVTAESFGGKKVNETIALTVQGSGYRFQDVSAEQWFYEAVDRMAADGHIKGISATHFGPGLDMSRADFVTLLGRLAGQEDKRVQTHFTDVPADSYYSGYVAWGVENGIVKGISDNLFGSADQVARSQMVTFLYRYAASQGADMTVADPEAVLARFPDGNALPDWSVDAFAWAIDRGVINGMDGCLAPDEPSNRAQVAVMLYRFFYEG